MDVWMYTYLTTQFSRDSILFDGALPASKKDVRIDRLQSYIARLKAFKKTSSSGLSSSSSYSMMTTTMTTGGSARKSLPPPPFLVFAVVEELVRSKYANVTFVVPGEADPFCVVAAAEAAAAQAMISDVQEAASPITIFSDDSDLIVFEAGAQTRIVPFRDLTVTEMGETTTTTTTTATKILQGYEYRPAEILRREKCHLSSLIKPAFFMSLDLFCNLGQALQLTAAAAADSSGGGLLDDREDYQAFAQQFHTSKEVQELAEIRSNAILKNSLASRDSRVSELVHQVQLQARGEMTGPMRVYLPFISDDPARSTAWNVGKETRVLAYSIVLVLLQQVQQQQQHDFFNIQEYRRTGARISAVLLELMSGSGSDTEGIISTSARLASCLQNGLDTAKGMNLQQEEDAWRFVVMQHVLTHLHHEGLTLPSIEDAVQVVLQGTGGSREECKERQWQMVHLDAQYQAAYYSFRMLQQLLAVTADTAVNHDDDFTNLRGILQSLPRISTFFSSNTAAGGGLDDQREREEEESQMKKWREGIEAMFVSMSILGDEGQDELENNQRQTRTRSRKKVKRRHQHEHGQVKQERSVEDAKLATNPYAMLAE